MRKVPPLHPEANRVLDIIATLEKDVVPPVSIDTMRALMKARTSRLAAEPPPVGRIENRSIAIGTSGDHQVPVRLYYPLESGGRLPAFIYAHGGGFVVGDLDMVDTICQTVCRDAGIVVVSVDYRLAPEHRFPAGLDDVIGVVRFVAEHALDLGIDANRIAIGGDSAGGNLAAAAALQLGEPGGVALRYQVLIYPVMDLTCSQPSYRDLGTGYPLTEERMRNYIRLYLDDPEQQASDPRASPLLVDTLTSLPPALVVVAGLDPLVDEGVAYARRLGEVGIDAEVVEVADHPHGFLGWTREAAAARETLALIGRRLHANLFGQS